MLSKQILSVISAEDDTGILREHFISLMRLNAGLHYPGSSLTSKSQAQGASEVGGGALLFSASFPGTLFRAVCRAHWIPCLFDGPLSEKWQL